ncbi:MAG: hypothetical protein PUJ51_22225 [Clostridiales bacterium]|uniref:hypothetical protein n=1 Tax=Terrisporobacter sp. TaxID=1965305 RepID=UPI002A5499DF|nr:hypothetical protein [Terrisporobacter sp.]MDD7757173.1 hypothetical protein [Clostridiales bacterium]MDY4137689.1 hypothetical protein [Terrisporobacter sp.]
MQKINFTDTTVTQKPYVTINNQNYEVQDGIYTGGTDLNANTFNAMQTNIEKAINENSSKIGELNNLNTTNKENLVGAVNEINLQKKVLYSNSNGSVDEITLSEDITNYDNIEIISTNDGNVVLQTVKINSPKNKKFMINYNIWDTGVLLISKIYLITTNKITPDSNSALYIASNATISYIRHNQDNNRIKIIKVIGYKK